MFETLKVRKEALEEAMNKKLDELKTLCLKEGELIGELPPETPLKAHEPLPQIQRRVGSGFTLNEGLIWKSKTKEEQLIAKLELEYEIQSKIVAAAAKLAKDVTVKKIVRKQRKHAFQQSLAKMKDLESRIVVVRRQIATSKSTKSRRNQSFDETTTDENVNHLNTGLHEKSVNSLNKFVVTEASNKQLAMRRSASLFSTSFPSKPNKLNDNQSVRRSLSPSITSVVNRSNLIQRPRSAAAKFDPVFDYDTDEESNEVLRKLSNDFNDFENKTSGENNNSDIYFNESNIRSTLENKYQSKAFLTNNTNQYNVVTSGDSSAIKTHDDTHLELCQTAINKNLKDYHNYKSYLSRSNSLDSNRRKRIGTKGSTDSNCQLYDTHHKHYHNHYPSYRAIWSDQSDYAPINASPLLTSIPQTNNKTSNYITQKANQNDYLMTTNSYTSSPIMSIDTIDKAFVSTQTLRNSSDIEESIAVRNEKSIQRSQTTNVLQMKDSMTGKHLQISNNFYSLSQPMTSTPKALNPWCETSLDFVLPTKSDSKPKENNYMKPINRLIEDISTSNNELTKELYINVTNASNMTSSPTSLTSSPQLMQSFNLSSLTPSIQSQDSYLNNDTNKCIETKKTITIDKLISKPKVIPMSPNIRSGKGVEVTVVSVGHFQPYWEEEKPFELEDFYKYSQKHRNSNQLVPQIVHNCDNDINNYNNNKINEINETKHSDETHNSLTDNLIKNDSSSSSMSSDKKFVWFEQQIDSKDHSNGNATIV